MHDDPKALFIESALSAYNAFIESIRRPVTGKNQDLRLAREAAVALYHLREHLSWTRGKSFPPDIDACADYHLLEDVVNVLKHGGPRREGNVASATDIYELVVFTEYEDAQGPYQDAAKRVEVKLKDGSVRDMEEVLRNVFNMWIANYQKQGVSLDLSPSVPPVNQIPARTSASGGARLDLRPTAGVRLQHSFRRQKYNYATGQIEGLDMTGHKYQFTVREPLEAILLMTNNLTGEVVEKVFRLSVDEQDQYESLKSDDQRAAYLDSLKMQYARRALAPSQAPEENI